MAEVGVFAILRHNLRRIRLAKGSALTSHQPHHNRFITCPPPGPVKASATRMYDLIFRFTLYFTFV